MKGFSRGDQLLSLCGLNCGLCPMKIDGYCPGCGGGPGNQSCSIARCSLQKGEIVYCFQCIEYPCEKYNGIDAYDSFITHWNQQANLQEAAANLERYHLCQEEKVKILHQLLADFNDGRRKSFFCLMVNLLELSDLREAMEQISEYTSNLSLKEKASYAAGQLREIAQRSAVPCKLRKKPAAAE